MAVRKIIQPDNPVLRQKARKVRDFDPKLHRLIDDMIETMLKAPGSGLAAPQVAVSERVIVVHYGETENEDTLYEVVNPEIVKASRETVDGIEGCLSIPGYAGLIERHESIILRGQDRNGKEIRIKAYDWLARIFQHEIDHLDGVLYTDKAKEVWQLGHMPDHVREMFDFEDEEDIEPGAEQPQDVPLPEEQDPPA